MTSVTMAEESKTSSTKRSVGVVGYGNVGKYIVSAILSGEAPAADALSLGWVWNRSASALDDVPEEYRLLDLDTFASRPVDVIIEVAHPSITAKYGAKFVSCADFVSGSPTAFADASVEASLRKAANASNGHGLYIPSGALWGAQVRVCVHVRIHDAGRDVFLVHGGRISKSLPTWASLRA